MTLKTAARIETAFIWLLSIIILPFILVAELTRLLLLLFRWIIDQKDFVCMKVGNKLLNESDATKDGTIKNPYCLRNYTARTAYTQLKEAKEKGIETNL